MSATSPSPPRITPRDLRLLRAVDRTPLTAGQLLRLSRTFPEPFTTLRRVQERLRALREAGLVNAYRYAFAGLGSAPAYHRLTRPGHHVLHGPGSSPTLRRSFSEIGVARHHHTHALGELLVHLFVAAHESGVDVVGFDGENECRIAVGRDLLYPDATLVLRPASCPTKFRFHVELDCGSERLRSEKECDSIARKLRLYEEHRDECGRPFRVLLVTTRSRRRLDGLTSVARDVLRHPGLVYGAFLPEFLTKHRPLTTPAFVLPTGRPVAMLPTTVARSRQPASAVSVAC